MSDIDGDEGSKNVGGGEIVRLPARQQAALEELLKGASIVESARAAGVTRWTVHAWLKQDTAFQAAYNRWREQMDAGCQTRLLALTDKAADAVQKALEAGDAKLGLALLKGLGLLAPLEKRPTDPEEVEQEMRLEKKRRRVTRDRANMDLDLG